MERDEEGTMRGEHPGAVVSTASPRLDYRHIVSGVGRAMSSLDQLVQAFTLAKQVPLLIELVKIRASQINGCAY
jgi:alkylhydroperoxidase family enzyme